MNKLFIIFLICFFVITSYSQNRAIIPKNMQDFGIRNDNKYNSINNKTCTVLPLKYTPLTQEENIGNTYYDLQSHASMQTRLHLFDDNTMGAVWTMGFDFSQYNDRGTGYNYFDGAEWGEWPDERIENYRTGWPAYAPYGENGEIIVSHISGSGPQEGLAILKRENKGTGEWEEFIFYGPPDFEDLYFPKLATGGVNNTVIHILALTNPILPYQGQEMALLYSRSIDGGTTWDPENYVIPVINASYYYGFDFDIYDLHADGENVAILIGGPWIDLVLLKSADGGDSWEKTTIWEHPYPFFDPSSPIVTDTFYCVDGSLDMDFDEDGMVHVVFGINRASADESGVDWFPAVGGIGYWNENRLTLSNNMNALNPYGHPDSELEDNYSLIGWTQDVNYNDTIEIIWEDIAYYYLGLSSMPQIYIDNNDDLFIVYSSVTEGYDNDAQSYRHLWFRFSPNGDWWGSFFHLTSDLVHIFDECVFPSLAYCTTGWSQMEIKLLYQHDNEPGMAESGDNDPYGQNFISFMSDYTLMPNIYESQEIDRYLHVSQNHPNPFKEKTTIQIKLKKTCDIKLEITNLSGEKVYENNLGCLNTGTHNISIEVPSLSPGIYFYSVVAGKYSVTKKMIVK